jgi:TolA-binding protein
VAREISTGLAEDPGASPAQTAALRAIDAALKTGNFAAAATQADALLATATGEPAAQAFASKARALEGQEQWEAAAAAWLRIPAHYPASPGAPAALLRASELARKLNHTQAAQALTDELRTQYPESKEAAALKPQ